MRQWPSALLLALWPSLSTAGDASADYYVRNLPGLPEGIPPVKMHAG